MASQPSTPIFRIKRRRSQDPADALVISVKKRKGSDDSCASSSAGDNGSPESVKTVLTLAGTLEVNESEKSLVASVEKLIKQRPQTAADLKSSFKTPQSAARLRSKSRHIARESVRNSRYKFLNEVRSISIEESDATTSKATKRSQDDAEGEFQNLVQLYDFMSENEPSEKKSKISSAGDQPEKISCNGVEMTREFINEKAAKEEYDYVYDLYYATDSKVQFTDVNFDEALVEDYDLDTSGMADEYRDFERHLDDDSDSNDEDNWRNDYPDELSDDDYGEKDYGDDDDDDFGMGRLNMKEEYELSTDDEDELLYTKSFQQDEAKHGASYAKYKQRMMATLFKKESGPSDRELDGDDDDDINNVDEF